MSQNDGIMLSRYLSPEPLKTEGVSEQRLKDIAAGRHPRPNFTEVCKIASELLERRKEAKRGSESKD